MLRPKAGFEHLFKASIISFLRQDFWGLFFGVWINMISRDQSKVVNFSFSSLGFWSVLSQQGKHLLTERSENPREKQRRPTMPRKKNGQNSSLFKTDKRPSDMVKKKQKNFNNIKIKYKFRNCYCIQLCLFPTSAHHLQLSHRSLTKQRDARKNTATRLQQWNDMDGSTSVNHWNEGWSQRRTAFHSASRCISREVNSRNTPLFCIYTLKTFTLNRKRVREPI